MFMRFLSGGIGHSAGDHIQPNTPSSTRAHDEALEGQPVTTRTPKIMAKKELIQMKVQKERMRTKIQTKLTLMKRLTMGTRTTVTSKLKVKTLTRPRTRRAKRIMTASGMMYYKC
jgi:hypothetical protein